MLKGGIFLDVENLTRNGGYGMRLRVVKDLVEAQGATVVRANAYLAVDTEREAAEPEFRTGKQEYRNRVRREGFHLVPKEVQRYRTAEGEIYMKANADLELAVDAVLQSENLDYVLLGSGDGDFTRLVRALQTRGRRVDLLAFSNVSGALEREVDYHHSGYLVPGILPPDRQNPDRHRGILHAVSEDRGFGFITVRTGLGLDEVRDDIFLHISDFRDRQGRSVDNETFARYKTRGKIIEFDTVDQPDGRLKAMNATEFVPEF